MNPALVYDASALLAVVFDEAGSEAALEYLARPGGLISAVNWAEVASKLADRGVPTSQLARELAAFGLDVVPLDETLALIAAGLRAETRSLGLSLGDRCCLALARQRNAVVITADRSWEALHGLKLALIR